LACLLCQEKVGRVGLLSFLVLRDAFPLVVDVKNVDIDEEIGPDSFGGFMAKRGTFFLTKRKRASWFVNIVTKCAGWINKIIVEFF
jgi:hypothetical protein